MNWFKLYCSGGLCLVFALCAMLYVEKHGGIAAEVADTIPAVVVPIVYILLTQEDQTRMEQANAVFASTIGTFSTLICFLPMWKIIPRFFSENRFVKCCTILFSWKLPVVVTIISSILAWVFGVIVLGYFQVLFANMHIPVGFYSIFIMALCVYIGVSRCVRIPPPEEEHKENCCMKIFRSITVILITIMGCIVSALRPNLLGNILPGFPNVFSSSILSVSFAQVALLPTGDLGPMILGGCSTGFFTMMSALLYGIVQWHPIVSIIVAHLVVLFFWSRPIHDYIQWRREVTAESIRQKKELKKQNRWWNRLRRSMKEKKEKKGEGNRKENAVVVEVGEEEEEEERSFWSFFLLRWDRNFFAVRRDVPKSVEKKEIGKSVDVKESSSTTTTSNTNTVSSGVFPTIPTELTSTATSTTSTTSTTSEPSKRGWNLFSKK